MSKCKGKELESVCGQLPQRVLLTRVPRNELKDEGSRGERTFNNLPETAACMWHMLTRRRHQPGDNEPMNGEGIGRNC